MIIIIITKLTAKSKHFDVCGDPVYAGAVRGFLKIIIIVSGLAFASTLILSTATAIRLGAAIATPSSKAAPEALFHLLAIVPADDQGRYFDRVVASMERAAKKDGAVLQALSYTSGDGPEAIARLLRLATELEPDGVIVNAPPDRQVIEAVRGLERSGVPVLALESDLPSSGRAVFIGTNPYSIGVNAASAVADSFPHGARVALVLSRDYAEGVSSGATIVAGFMHGARGRNGLQLAMTRTAQEGPAASEEIVRELLSEHSDIDVAVFIGSRDSEGAARAILEYDKVGRLAIIGFDDDPALLELIQMGVVTASIARSPDRSGEEAVKAAMTMARGGRASAYIDPGLRVIRREGGTR